MEVRPVDDADALAIATADLVADAVARRPDLLMLAATGDTPMGTYSELARRVERGELETARLRIAQLDEYLGLGPDDRRSLYGWTRRSVCEPLRVTEDRTIRLRGDDPDPEAACRDYDATVAQEGGVDLALLGLGPNGHLGFNEPPTDADAPTRVVALTPESLVSNARYWGADAVPARALTAGMSIIVGARRVVLLVTGSHKAGILRRTLESSPSAELPATWLHRHPDAVVIADRAALG